MDGAGFKREDLDNGTAILTISGELDVSNARELRRRINEIVTSDVRGLVLDLAELAHIDSSGLAELITAHQRAAAHGAKLVLAFDSAQLQRTIEVRGLDTLSTISPTRDDAIAALAPR